MHTKVKSLFSRRTLNIIIFLCVVSIVALSQLNGHDHLEGPFNSITRIEQGSELVSPKLNIQHWVNDNGARVYFVESPELPMLDIRLIFDAGSARDDEQLGLAAMTGNTIGEGAVIETDGVQQSIDATAIAMHFENLGASFGSGAYRDMAVVELRSLTDTDLLTPALDMFTAVLSQPTFPQDALVRGKNSTLASIQHSKQNPGSLASKAFYKAIYNDHPYANPSIGIEESVAKFNQQDLKDFHQQYYTNNNVVIALVGAISRQRAEEIAEQVTKSLPAGESAPTLQAVNYLSNPDEPTTAEFLSQHIEHDSSQTHIIIGAPTIQRGDESYIALSLGNEILGGGLGSLLSDEIREKRGLAYSIYSGFSPMHAPGPFSINLQTRNDQTEQALKIINETLTSFINDGPNEQQLQETKQYLTGSFPLRTASNSSIVSYLGVIGFYGLPLDYLDTYTNKVNQLTIEDVKTAFQEYVKPEQLTIITVGASAQTTDTEPAQLNN